MPCSDGGVPYPSDEPRFRAALCGVLGVLDSGDALEAVLDAVDWDEAGVTREWVVGWFAEHRREDEIRRAAERRRKERIIQRQAILAKLTPEEREILRGKK